MTAFSSTREPISPYSCGGRDGYLKVMVGATTGAADSLEGRRRVSPPGRKRARGPAQSGRAGTGSGEVGMATAFPLYFFSGSAAGVASAAGAG